MIIADNFQRRGPCTTSPGRSLIFFFYPPQLTKFPLFCTLCTFSSSFLEFKRGENKPQAMGTGKKEASRRERQGKVGDGMANVRTKGENFYR